MVVVSVVVDSRIGWREIVSSVVVVEVVTGFFSSMTVVQPEAAMTAAMARARMVGCGFMRLQFAAHDRVACMNVGAAESHDLTAARDRLVRRQRRNDGSAESRAGHGASLWTAGA